MGFTRKVENQLEDILAPTKYLTKFQGFLGIIKPY